MPESRIVLFFLIDAMGWEIVRRLDIPNRYPNRCASKLNTILGYSCGAIPTILTGKYPDEHGRWNLLRYAPSSSPFGWTRRLDRLPRRWRSHRYARKAIDLVAKRVAGSDGYFSSYGLPVEHLKLFDVCETRKIYQPQSIEGATNIFDHFVELQIPYKSYSYHDGSDSALLDQMQQDVQSGTESVYFCYLADLDDYLHHHCDNVAGVDERVLNYFSRIDDIVNVAQKRSHDVRHFIFSDHGMTPVTEHYDLIGDLRRAGVGPDCGYVSVFDSTMARFWIDDRDTLSRVRQVLSDCPAGQILEEDELRELRIFFADGRYGKLIFLMNPGTLILPNVFGTHAPVGMHGYHPSDRHSAAACVSNVDDWAPKEIRDMYDIIITESQRSAGLSTQSFSTA